MYFLKLSSKWIYCLSIFFFISCINNKSLQQKHLKLNKQFQIKLNFDKNKALLIDNFSKKETSLPIIFGDNYHRNNYSNFTPSYKKSRLHILKNSKIGNYLYIGSKIRGGGNTPSGDTGGDNDSEPQEEMQDDGDDDSEPQEEMQDDGDDQSENETQSDGDDGHNDDETESYDQSENETQTDSDNISENETESEKSTNDSENYEYQGLHNVTSFADNIPDLNFNFNNFESYASGNDDDENDTDGDSTDGNESDFDDDEISDDNFTSDQNSNIDDGDEKSSLDLTYYTSNNSLNSFKYNNIFQSSLRSKIDESNKILEDYIKKHSLPPNPFIKHNSNNFNFTNNNSKSYSNNFNYNITKITRVYKSIKSEKDSIKKLYRANKRNFFYNTDSEYCNIKKYSKTQEELKEKLNKLREELIETRLFSKEYIPNEESSSDEEDLFSREERIDNQLIGKGLKFLGKEGLQYMFVPQVKGLEALRNVYRVGKGIKFLCDEYNSNLIIKQTEDKPNRIIIEEFIKSATKPNKNGLNNVGRALQKHSTRKGPFSNIKFFHKDADIVGEKILRDILNSKHRKIVYEPNNTTTIYDMLSRRGVNVSRKGIFNGFRGYPKN